MCNSSPAKVIRSVKRITRFLEQKPNKKLSIRNEVTLSVKVLPQTNCDPLPPKTLSVSRLQPISLQALPRKLSYRKFPSTEIVPGMQNDDDYLFSSYINGGSLCTTFVCSFCYDDYSFKSADSIRLHVFDEHRLDMYQRLKSKPPFEPEFEELNW